MLLYPIVLGNRLKRLLLRRGVVFTGYRLKQVV
jgi:hypothetical protein